MDEITQKHAELASDEQIYRWLHFLFMEFVAHKELTTDQIPAASMVEFASWANRFVSDTNRERILEAVKTLQISTEMFTKITELLSLDKQQAYGLIATYWPLLVLAPRPPLKNVVKQISISAKIIFEDGKVFEVDASADPNPSRPFTDASILACWTRFIPNIFKLITKHGTDELHDKHAQ